MEYKEYMNLFGIDSGPLKSGWVHLFAERMNGTGPLMLDVVKSGHEDNYLLQDRLGAWVGMNPKFPVVIEKIVAHKWSGTETSDAAIWSGIFAGVDLMNTFFITRSKVRWAILRKRQGGDKEIKEILLSGKIGNWSHVLNLPKKMTSHEWAALSVAVTYLMMPLEFKRGIV